MESAADKREKRKARSVVEYEGSRRTTKVQIRRGLRHKGRVLHIRWSGYRSSSWGDDDQILCLPAVFCCRNTRYSQGLLESAVTQGRELFDRFREREGDECSTRCVRPEEARNGALL